MGLEPTNLLTASGLRAFCWLRLDRVPQVKWGVLSVALAGIGWSLAIWIAKWITKSVS